MFVCAVSVWMSECTLGRVGLWLNFRHSSRFLLLNFLLCGRKISGDRFRGWRGQSIYRLIPPPLSSIWNSLRPSPPPPATCCTCFLYGFTSFNYSGVFFVSCQITVYILHKIKFDSTCLLQVLHAPAANKGSSHTLLHMQYVHRNNWWMSVP